MTVTSLKQKNIADRLISGNVSIAPLVTFRVIFGLVMLISLIRFAANGWIYEFYVQPEFHFTFLGFDWVKPLPEAGMYLVFFIMGLAALFIAIGLFYRYAAIAFFLLFTYVELIDKTFYLNHYYFISIVSFLLIWVPAHKYLSIDTIIRPSLAQQRVPAWTVNIFKLQLGIVYFYAGLAKINPEWMLEALPLKIWLPARAYFPIIGPLFKELWVAFAFSWAGMLYDLFIPFFLLNKKTRGVGYLAVVFFHIMTWLLFPIGMFPFIMIGLTLIFFSQSFHQKILGHVTGFLKLPQTVNPRPGYRTSPSAWIVSILAIHFAVQLIFPLRSLLYPGNLFWTEQGYRFSWRVMLMEKAGMCDFFVREKNSQKLSMINNRDHLTIAQERMMSTQPDMILQFAHYLKEKYGSEEVYVDSHVTLQGTRSQPIVDPETNLAQIERNWKHKNWILPFEDHQ